MRLRVVFTGHTAHPRSRRQRWISHTAIGREIQSYRDAQNIIRVEEIDAARGATTQLDVLLGDHLDASRERGGILKISPTRRYRAASRLAHSSSTALARSSPSPPSSPPALVRLVHHLHQRFLALAPRSSCASRFGRCLY